MRRGPLRGWRRIGLLGLLVVLMVPAVAAAIGISLNRTPRRPRRSSAAAAPSSSITRSPSRPCPSCWALRFSDPAGGVVQSATFTPSATTTSPISQTGTYSPPPVPSSAATGRRLNFFSSPTNLEASALVAFDVADQLGTLQLVKFEDVNGNGVRDAGEPGVPAWSSA